MIEISFQSFLDYLLNFNRIIPGELLINNYLRHNTDCLTNFSKKFYYTNGFVVDFSVYKTQNNSCQIYCFMYQISDNCDLGIAVELCKNIIKEEEKKHKSSKSELRANVAIEIAKGSKGHIETYRFSRFGDKFESDDHIHKIGFDNAPEAKDVCEKGKINDTFLDKIVANNFINYINFDWDSYNNMIGYYENNQFVGLASYYFYDEANIAHFENVHVIPEFRNKGIGKKLVYSALAAYPDKQWLYQAGVKK